MYQGCLRIWFMTILELCAENTEKQITITSQIEPNLRMTAHEVSLRRAITNLVDNAIKFTNTTIDISAKLVNHELVITVSDNGIGIEQENLEHIWDRMYQTEQSRNKKIKSRYRPRPVLCKQSY